MTDPGIDIVVPVFDGRPHLDRCLERLAATLDPDAFVWLVDDASPDASVLPLLHDWAGRIGDDRCRVVAQAGNLGFVATVNAAMARCRRDAVLLNADTVPTPGWLAAMRACAGRDQRIGTITPWSNNAEICSFPLLCQRAPMPAPGRIDDLAGAAASLPEAAADLPTAVGFCMYIRRRAWDQAGGFDADTFGRGYGEENDFCRRIAGLGWRNVLCSRAYVGHVGGVSFASVGLGPGGEALRRLVERHPDYERVVAEFIQADPLAPHRRQLLDALADRGWAAGEIEALYPVRSDPAAT